MTTSGQQQKNTNMVEKHQKNSPNGKQQKGLSKSADQTSVGVQSRAGRRHRLRRTTSVGRAEDIVDAEQRARRSQPDSPIHRNCDSLLSWRAQFTEYSGFVNWGFTLLAVGGIRLMLENYRKYGLLVDPPQWFYALNGGPFSFSDRYPSVLTLMYLQLHAFVALALEKLLARGLLSAKLGGLVHACNVVLILLTPHIVVTYIEEIPLIGLMVVSFDCVILALKLTSYAHVNKWCREAASGRSRHRSLSYSKSFENLSLAAAGADYQEATAGAAATARVQRLVKYPDNLNVADMLYYLVAPTLCYELNYPRTDRIRVWFVVRRVVELLFGVNLALALFQQWIIPSVRNSLEPFSRMDLPHVMERLLKLAVPNHLLWIGMFYLVFHSFLNLVGEITQFGDRKFYVDWWNARDINTFWRTWNIPVHRFAIRHIYLPMQRHGFGKFTSALAVFTLSAALHEYLVAAPLRILRIWAFSGMLAQIPFDIISVQLRRLSPRLSNVFVWLSLIIGQPLAIMMYYHDYLIEKELLQTTTN